MPALLKTSALQANASLPKAWLEPLLKASGKPDVSAEDVEGMLGMAQATGYARLEGDKLVSALKMQDRKSTRLNSSHSQISYAVFCLKKKKTQQNTSNSQISYAVFSLKKKIMQEYKHVVINYNLDYDNTKRHRDRSRSRDNARHHMSW